METRSGCSFSLLLGVVLTWISIAHSQFTGEKPVQSMEQFPHHVTVHRYSRYGEFICSASVIHEKWLLTTPRCVAGADYLKFDFKAMGLNSHNGSFSITTDNTSVRVYPNGYDEVALVELPTPLSFSKTLKPIVLDRGSIPIERKLGVMTSFSSRNSSLTYGMYRILSKGKCQRLLGPNYNKYQQICAEAWSSSYKIPCRNLEGTSLIVGWPQSPVLVGIFSVVSCNSYLPVIHARISEYVDWILDTTHQIPTTTPGPMPTTGPTEPTTKTTEPWTWPTPTWPTTKPTEPWTWTTTKTTEPWTWPTTKPTEPWTWPTPTWPTTKPTDPWTWTTAKPTEPWTWPTTKPTEPWTWPTPNRPTTKPTDPWTWTTAKPTEPTTKPWTWPRTEPKEPWRTTGMREPSK